MNMVVGCAAYEGGRKIADLDIEHLDAFETGKGRFVWIGLHETGLDFLQKAQKRLGMTRQGVFGVEQEVRAEPVFAAEGAEAVRAARAGDRRCPECPSAAEARDLRR